MEVKTTAIEKKSETTAIVAVSADLLKGLALDALSASPLMVGKKYDTDELLTCDYVTLNNVDSVDYDDSNGEHTHFAVFTVTPVKNNKPLETGYHCGGMVLTKLGDAIFDGGEEYLESLRVNGLRVKLSQKLTATKNHVTTVEIL